MYCYNTLFLEVKYRRLRIVHLHSAGQRYLTTEKRSNVAQTSLVVSFYNQDSLCEKLISEVSVRQPSKLIHDFSFLSLIHSFWYLQEKFAVPTPNLQTATSRLIVWPHPRT
jgi:hypothetical protein